MNEYNSKCVNIYMAGYITICGDWRKMKIQEPFPKKNVKGFFPFSVAS